MKKTKVFALILIVPCIIALTACGGGVKVKNGTYNPTHFLVDGQMIAIVDFKDDENVLTEFLNGLELTETERNGLQTEFLQFVTAEIFMSNYVQISGKNISLSSNAGGVGFQVSGPFQVKSNGRFQTLGSDLPYIYKNGKIYEDKKVNKYDYDTESGEIVSTVVAEYKLVYAK